MDKPQIIVHVQKTLDYSPFDVKWLPRSAKAVTVGSYPRSTGVIQIHELCQGDVNLVQSIDKPTALKCCTFGASSLAARQLAVGSFDGHLDILDLNQPETPTYSVNAHTQIVNCIDGVGGLGIGEGAPELVTGSRDGYIKVWDPRQKDKPVVNIEPTDINNKRDCWTVAFGNAHSAEDRAICIGFDNGDIKLIDLRTMGVKWEVNVGVGVCSVEFDRKDISMNKLVATTLEAKFHVFDLSVFHEKKGYAKVKQKAHDSTVWCAKYLPQNREIFMSTGGDGSLNLWKYSYPESRKKKFSDGTITGVPGKAEFIQKMNIAELPITSFDWNRDKQGLAACTGLDQSLRIVIVTKLNTL
ncbi:dynein axonemal assembly factor 10 [Oratosquilla oratoria]|uniref:dynein axonemal assembly factor 10 n=1 Tax=Oratosquilla oratoria TaxID=337810 RepID=UPI003F76557F